MAPVAPIGDGESSAATSFARAPGPIAAKRPKNFDGNRARVAAGKSSCCKTGSSRRRDVYGREGQNSVRLQKPGEIVSPQVHCHGFEYPTLQRGGSPHQQTRTFLDSHRRNGGAYGCSGRARTCASIPSIGGGIADRFGYPSVGLFAEMALALAFVLHLRRLEREAATAHVTKSAAGSSKASWEWSLLLGRKS